MLVLSRRKDEQIVIGDRITLTIVDVRGDKVRLGIDAPKDVPVHRREVYDAIRRQMASRERQRPEKSEQPNGSDQPTGSSDGAP
jgi:carbon storage regulator